MQRSYLDLNIKEFLVVSDFEIMGQLASAHAFDLEINQRHAWEFQVQHLKQCIEGFSEGKIIHDDLVNNRPYEGSSDTLSDSQVIKQGIKRLKSALDGLLNETFVLKKQISGLGIDEIVDWDEYFSKQKQTYVEAFRGLTYESLVRTI